MVSLTHPKLRKGVVVLQITDVKIRSVSDEGICRAMVSVTFDNQFCIHEIRIIQKGDKLFVAMPNRRDKTGVYRDIAHPISIKFRNEVENQILDEYERYMASAAVADDNNQNS
jgi:stage V sporulation protein G